MKDEASQSLLEEVDHGMPQGNRETKPVMEEGGDLKCANLEVYYLGEGVKRGEEK